MDAIITTSTAAVTTIDGSLCERFIAYLDVSSKRTIETYRRALRQFVYFLRDNNIIRPVREDVIEYREQLKERVKATTVQSYITVVKLFFRWTEREGLYPNIADHIKSAKISREHKRDCLTAEQAKSVLKNFNRSTIQGRRDYAIFCLMVSCGLRDIEVNRANIEDLRTMGNHTVLYLQGKGREDKAEYVKIQPVIEEAIRASLKDRTTAAGSDPLFTSLSNNSKGRRMSTRSISGIIKQALVSAGYNSDRLTAHSLRHTAVTISLLNEIKLEEVQQFARHRNLATTLIYAHNLERANNKCESTIANALFA